MQFLKNYDFKEPAPTLPDKPFHWSVQSVDETGQPIDTDYSIGPSGLTIKILPRNFSTNIFQSVTLEPGQYALSTVLQSNLQPSPQPDITASFFIVQGVDREMLGLYAPFTRETPNMPGVILEVQGGPCTIIIGLSFWVRQARFDGEIIVEHLFLRDTDVGEPSLIITPPVAPEPITLTSEVPQAMTSIQPPAPVLEPLDALVGLTLSVTVEEGVQILKFLGDLRREEY